MTRARTPGCLLTAAMLFAAAGASARPGYLQPTHDAGSTLVRIAGDAGTPIEGLAGTWGTDARHVYSKQQPWNADGSLLLLQNRGGGAPSRVLLDGRTYAPRAACDEPSLWDFRWHPQRAHVLINVDKAGRELSWYDVVAHRKVARWTLPVAVDYGIGSGEGNPSKDGRYVALANAEVLFVVDMAAPSGAARTGPLHRLVPCGVDPGSPASDCRIGNVSISPSGRYVDVKFKGETDETKDLHRILEVDLRTLALAPHEMSAASTRCGSFAGRTDGWIFPLKHADMTLDPYDGNEDVLVGGRSCAGSALGRVVKVRLRDGRVTALTEPRGEASVSHVSTRNLARPGWAYVTYFRQPGKRGSDEIVAVRLDGRALDRFGRTHTAASGCYRCEAHGVPSPDGRRVLFASNWAVDCGDGCGSTGEIAAYVLQRSTTNRPERSPSAVRAR